MSAIFEIVETIKIRQAFIPNKSNLRSNAVAKTENDPLGLETTASALLKSVL